MDTKASQQEERQEVYADLDRAADEAMEAETAVEETEEVVETAAEETEEETIGAIEVAGDAVGQYRT